MNRRVAAGLIALVASSLACGAGETTPSSAPVVAPDPVTPPAREGKKRGGGGGTKATCTEGERSCAPGTSRNGDLFQCVGGTLKLIETCEPMSCVVMPPGVMPGMDGKAMCDPGGM